jgi:hypothetical protein
MTPGVRGETTPWLPWREPPVERDVMKGRSGTAAEPIPWVLFRQATFPRSYGLNHEGHEDGF